MIYSLWEWGQEVCVCDTIGNNGRYYCGVKTQVMVAVKNRSLMIIIIGTHIQLYNQSDNLM